MKGLFIKIFLLLCVCLILGGCASGITTSTEPKPPVTHTLNSAVYCTVIPNTKGIEAYQFQAELNVSVTVNETSRDEISFSMITPDDWKHDFSTPNVQCFS